MADLEKKTKKVIKVIIEFLLASLLPLALIILTLCYLLNNPVNDQLKTIFVLSLTNGVINLDSVWEDLKRG